MGAGWLILDRDGVLNRRVPDGYVRCRDEFDPLPGALETVAALSLRAGATVVVTNQAGVGRGLVASEELAAIHAELVARCRDLGGRIDAVFACVHTREDRCGCRKPATGLFDRARRLIGDPDPKRSVMVGDMRSDAEFAAALGIRFVLIGDQDWSGWPPVHHQGVDLVSVAHRVAQHLSR
jgi:D-glycero-D-manno-heptose 1,7-bisphosphate phosphatase